MAWSGDFKLMVTVCFTGPGAHDWLIEFVILYRCLVVFGLSPCGAFVKLYGN